MYSPMMRLSKAEQAILSGDKGETLRKALETIVRFGDVFGADTDAKISTIVAGSSV
ncbi:hypothetical protein MASR2M78_08030 [Treponema sp.]